MLTRFSSAALLVLLSLIYFPAHAAEMTISGTPAATVAVGERYRFLPTVKNGNMSDLQFTYVNKPDWSKHYRSSGLIMGTPTEPGVYANIQIGVWDGAHYAIMRPFTITVVAAGSAGPVPTALQISGTPATTAVLGHLYSFKPTVVAPAGAALKFTIANKPSWAAFSETTGTLSGTPPEGCAPVYAGVAIGVSSGATHAVLPSFMIDVFAPSGEAPATGTAYITWNRPTVNADGSPLTDLSGYLIRYGTSASTLTKQVIVKSASASELQIDNLETGMWYFAVAAINTAQAVSQFSQVVGGTIK